MKRLIATITACAALALASQAGAEELVTREHSVAISSIDFKDSKQVDGLYRQLKTSASKVCRSSGRNLADRVGERECRNAALDGAIKKIAQEPLASRHTQTAALATSAR